MNGWADAEPAWWLNLRAQPETIVELKDGPRAVRARVAAGAERESRRSRSTTTRSAALSAAVFSPFSKPCEAMR